ncbi:hypothetical protein MLD38_023338 [Melastoma candidum]|uniref:Uncharacterized protein n=1 Tax=Melastoma candidum TaxID=119954 RepID=A0ACB9QNE4_9MYRT|nr:hypothetical protein MLD38_023338 [Melastoma candidum]
MDPIQQSQPWTMKSSSTLAPPSISTSLAESSASDVILLPLLSKSQFSTAYTTHLSVLSTRVNCLAVSIQYCLVPEHRLQTAFDDVWSSVK